MLEKQSAPVLPKDMKKKIEKNQLLNMVNEEQFKGFKSVKCYCGRKTALLERPDSFQAKIS